MNRPKSAELRIGHSNVTEFKPHAPIDVPAPPKKFSAVETRLWNEIWSAGRTAYQTTDSHIIERYVSLLARREDLLEMIETEGVLASKLSILLPNYWNRPKGNLFLWKIVLGSILSRVFASELAVWKVNPN